MELLMQMPSPRTPRNTPQGVSLSEYAILLGLVGVLSVAGLKALGVSTSNLFQGSSNTLASHNTLSLLDGQPQPIKTNLAASTGPLPGKGYYGIVSDPANGLPVLQLVNGSQGAATNVSSIDGTKMNTLGTIMLANALDKLASAETDPELQNYYSRLARLSYYLGGAEGELDDVAGLQGYYDNADALRDVLAYKSQLQSLMLQPPPGMDPAAIDAVMPLTANVYNIAQNYANALSKYVKPDGSIQNFYDGQSTTNGNPGDLLKHIALTAAKPDIPTGRSYDQLVSYDQMKSLSSQVLAAKNVESVPVVSTLTSATEVDAIATDPATASPSATTVSDTSSATTVRGCHSTSKGSS